MTEEKKRTSAKQRRFFLSSGNNIYDQPWHGSYKGAKSRCCKTGRLFHRGIKFLLTPDEFEKLWIRDKGWLLKNPSIDRIDTNGNYEYSNCQFIELIDNVKKNPNRVLTEEHKNKIRLFNLKLNGVSLNLSADQIIAMRKEGLSMVKIAERFNCSWSTLYHILQKASRQALQDDGKGEV